MLSVKTLKEVKPQRKESDFDIIDRFNQIFKKKPISSEDAANFLGKENSSHDIKLNTKNSDVLFSLDVKI